MAQLRNVGQGQQYAVIMGPLTVSIMLLMGLIFALFGIKIWGFRRRLTFDRGETTGRTTGGQQQQQHQQQRQTAPRYAAYESQINGTDNAVHGVFRQRNIEEFESTRPSPSSVAVNRYITGSVPNLRLHGLSSPDESTIGSGLSTVVYRPEAPHATERRRRREVNSAQFDFYNVPPPPTRQPPAPPTRQPPGPPTSAIAIEAAIPAALPAVAAPAIAQRTVEPPLELGIPNFDHFAEKYELISAQASGSSSPTKQQQNQLRNKDSGRYVKFDPVDDVPEIMTPDDGQVGEAIAVTAVVHQQKSEELVEPEIPRSSLEQVDEQNDTAFVMEILAETTPSSPGIMESNLFTDLELPSNEANDTIFQRIRSNYELNEADILDFDQLQLPVPSSPPGFGKSIEEDWENFENLDEVVARATEILPEPNWAEHPNLEHVEVQQVDLFHELELIDPIVEAEVTTMEPQPPPYEAGMPPFLPDYEFLMHMENSKDPKDSLPNYSDVVAKKEAQTKYVTNIDDLYAELEVTNGETSTFDELCEELEIVPIDGAIAQPPEPARRAAPLPAPRTSRPPVTLNVRGGNAPPLSCYQPDELPSSSSSEDEARALPSFPTVPPQPAKRKVRFDTENLQYYQSAEVPSSSESDDMDYTSSGMPKLFGRQVSQDDSDDIDDEDDNDDDDDDADDTFTRAVNQHRSMTQAIPPPPPPPPPVIELELSKRNDTEA